MRTAELDERMRAMERFHALRLEEGVYPVIRVDGRTFSRLTADRFEKPFDQRFHEAMVATAESVLNETRGIYAYTQSDEISIVYPREWDFFDREVEKIVSVTASIASATFSLAISSPAVFDSRLIAADDKSRVIDYFRWRQGDAGRCALNGWCYWTLRKAGKSAREATRLLDRKDVAYKNEVLREKGIPFAKLPSWQRRGTGLYWKTIQKEGYDPKKRRKVTATRRRVRVDENLPAGEAYDRLLNDLLRDSRRSK